MSGIGILALQGDFDAHAQAFAHLDCEVREVRAVRDLGGVEGLVLPGGETTTLIKLLHAFDLWEPVRTAPLRGVPLFGTCAGLILLAERILDPLQEAMGLLPITVRRNAYGRQVASFVTPGQVRRPADLGGREEILATEFVFIRAPRIEAVHNDALEILARHEGTPVLVRHGLVLGCSFHPELTRDPVVQRLFLAIVDRSRGVRAANATQN